MAFLSKIGNMVRQSTTRHIISRVSLPTPAIFQAARCMSSSRLFIGGISHSTDERSLSEAFGKYGQVADATIITDREIGRSRGFSFVSFTSVEEASSATQALDGQDLHGRRIKVSYAINKPNGSPPTRFVGNYSPPSDGYDITGHGGAGAGSYDSYGGAGGYRGGAAGGYVDGSSSGYGGGAGCGTFGSDGGGAGGYGSYANASGYRGGAAGGYGDGSSNGYGRSRWWKQPI